MGARQRTVLQILKLILRFTILLVCPITFEPLKTGYCAKYPVISKKKKEGENLIFLLN